MSVVPHYASRDFPGPDVATFTHMAAGSRDTIEVVVVDREYGAGNRTAFAARSMPAELRSAGVEQSRFETTVMRINEILHSVESITASVIAVNTLAVLSCFSIYLCLPNPYHKALDQIWSFLDAENRTYYEARRVQFQNPAANGLTHIDVLVRRVPDDDAVVKRKKSAGAAAATVAAGDDADGEDTANTPDEQSVDVVESAVRALDKPDSLQSLLQDSDSQTALLGGRSSDAGAAPRRGKKHK